MSAFTDLWPFLGALLILVTFTNGVYLWALKLMLSRHQTHVDTKLAEHTSSLEKKLIDISEATNKTNERVGRVERDFADFRLEVTKHYMPREDWIRDGTTINAKLDSIWVAIGQLKERFNGRRPETH